MIQPHTNYPSNQQSAKNPNQQSYDNLLANACIHMVSEMYADIIAMNFRVYAKWSLYFTCSLSPNNCTPLWTRILNFLPVNSVTRHPLPSINAMPYCTSSTSRPNTSMTTFLLLLSVFLAFTLFSTLQAAHHDTAVNYWKSFYPTIPIPSLVSQHISPMSSDEIDTIVSLIHKKTLSSNLPLFCKTARLICSTNDIPKIMYPTGTCIIYNYHHSTITAEAAVGTFLRESTLKKGTQFSMGKIKLGQTPAKYFLPHAIASLLTLKQSGSLFQSTTVRDLMSMPINMCNTLAPDEITKCPSSVEELVEFSAKVFPDRRMKVIYSKSSDGAGTTVILDNIRPLLHENPKAKIIVCHGLFFPYTVMRCHATSDAQVYQVDLVHPETLEKINDGMVAVCHRNTMSWNPNHVAFAALGLRHGDTVCHWMSTESIAFVHLDDTLSG